MAVCGKFPLEESMDLVTGRRGRRRKQLLDDFKGTGGYWKLKQGALYGSLWKIPFGRVNGPIVRQIVE